MKTRGVFHLRSPRSRILVALAFLTLAVPAEATFHFMQIEQVIGGVNGDTTAQAVQLRMRLAGQTEVGGSQLVVYDAAGNNPITLLTFPSDVGTGAAGSRILITSSSFASYEATPITSDFTMTSTIPASYLAAGRLAFQNSGLIFWSVSWGGAGYTGPNTGRMENDADGNFGPPFAGVLPSATTSSLRFTGAAGAMSTNNAADYSVTAGSATFTNNAGASTSLILRSRPRPNAFTTSTPGTLGNISTRLRVLSGDNALIGGMIATGTAGKRVIIRAIGPSLIPFGVPGALANPTLDLFQGSTLLFSNDDWGSSPQQAEIAASGLAPSHDPRVRDYPDANAGSNLHGGGARDKQLDRHRSGGSLRSGSGRGLEAGEHQHARICGRGRQRDDRGLDRGTGQWNESQDPGASARTDADRFWGRRSLGESDARSGEFEWDGDSLEQRLERRSGNSRRRFKRPD